MTFDIIQTFPTFNNSYQSFGFLSLLIFSFTALSSHLTQAPQYTSANTICKSKLKHHFAVLPLTSYSSWWAESDCGNEYGAYISWEWREQETPFSVWCDKLGPIIRLHSGSKAIPQSCSISPCPSPFRLDGEKLYFFECRVNGWTPLWSLTHS